MRTTWGKLYSFDILRKCVFERAKQVTYGVDTMVVLEALRNANRVGILAKSLHKYYVSPDSVSYKFESKRVASDKILLETAREFLISKTGVVSVINDEFLIAVYMNALIDTLKVLLGAEMPDAERLSAMCNMFLCEHARNLAARERFGERFGAAEEWQKKRRELFETAIAWLRSREEVADEQVEDYCELGEFLCAACEIAEGWLFFNRLRVRFLIDTGRADDAHPKIDELLKLLPDDAEMMDCAEKIRK
jgi:hypothetical protein